MWRTLAKRLRDWLNYSLAERADDPAREKLAGGPVAPQRNTDSSIAASEQAGTGENSNAGEQADASAWSALQPSGPPEDWLRRVQEGAPELLRYVEERGTLPWDASPTTASDNSGSRATTMPKESLSRFSTESFPEASEQPVEDARQCSSSAESHPNSWFNRLQTLLRSPEPAERREEAKRRLQVHSVGSGTAGPETAGEPLRQLRALQQPLAESEPREARAARRALGWISHWIGLTRQGTQASLPAQAGLISAPPKEIVSKTLLGHRTEEVDNAKTGEKQRRSPFPEHIPIESRAGHFHTTSDGRLSDRPASRLSLEWPSLHSAEYARGSKPQDRSRNTAELKQNSLQWTSLPTDAQLLRNRDQKGAKSNTVHAANEKAASPASLRLDSSSFLSPRWVEPEKEDPWPELPEGREGGSPNWRASLYNSEHFRALDLEQRGGR
jgi:hypothetical protein